ncbi:MAG: hypothetical protein ACI9CF_001950 [Candidatus Omnitrophota bacterium]|jgi:hypothetical protein
MWIIGKIVISGIIIAFASWFAGKRPILAGFIIALPLMSMLSILFTYAEYKDMDKVNQFAVSILVAVPLSLTFFVPFVVNRWIKLNFMWTYLAAIGCLVFAYWVHQTIFNTK